MGVIKYPVDMAIMMSVHAGLCLHNFIFIDDTINTCVLGVGRLYQAFQQQLSQYFQISKKKHIFPFQCYN